MEEWRPVKGFEGIYEVSSLGRVRSLPRTLVRKNGKEFKRKEKYLTHTITYQSKYPDKVHYVYVSLTYKGIRKMVALHRLVAEAFVLNPSNSLNVNHIDRDRQNNAAVNLEWVTHQENMKHYSTVQI